jgi:hypothetical protein
MNPNPKNLVLIYVKLPWVLNTEPRDQSMAMRLQDAKQWDFHIEQLFAQRKDGYVRLGSGVFLADEDGCYPAILALIGLCQQSGWPLAIVPLGERPLTFSMDDQGWRKWLDGNGHLHRLTVFPPKQQPAGN